MNHHKLYNEVEFAISIHSYQSPANDFKRIAHVVQNRHNNELVDFDLGMLGIINMFHILL